MGTSRRSHARRAALAVAVALCAAGIGASAAQAATPLVWSAPTQADQNPGTLGLTALSCQALTLCVAVDDSGNFLSTTAATTPTWSPPLPIAAGNPRLTAVSCPAASLCIAVDNVGNGYSSATPASQPWTKAAIDGANQLNAVSCPSTGLCVAGDNNGNVLTSVAPSTAAWTAMHVDGTNHVTAVSCPSASLCAAVDDHGNVLLSTNPTSQASWQLTPLLAGSIALTAVSCNASGLCVAVAHDGTVHATANATAAAVTWSATPVDTTPLTGVSCSDVGLCVLVDHAGNALESDNPAAGPPTWTATAIDQAHPLTGVSCLSAGFCVAIDDHGFTMAAVLPAPVVATGTGAASSQTTASLTGTVNPDDATLSTCHFDFGPTVAYGASVPCTVVPNATGGSQAVLAALSGLNAATTYHFRIAASSGVATGDGNDATFTTPPPLKANPSLSGTPAVGNTLTCKPNVTTTATEAVTYAWLSDTVPIVGATAPTYVVALADQGHHLSCQVTISGDGGSAAATSGFDGVPSQTQGKITETFVGTDTRGANSVSAPVSCSPQATGSCTITLLLSSKQTIKHRLQTVTVGSSTTKLAAGTTRRLSVSLNASGRRLLKRQHTLTATLTVRGTIIGTLKATLQTNNLVFGTKSKHATRHRR